MVYNLNQNLVSIPVNIKAPSAPPPDSSNNSLELNTPLGNMAASNNLNGTPGIPKNPAVVYVICDSDIKLQIRSEALTLSGATKTAHTTKTASTIKTVTPPKAAAEPCPKTTRIRTLVNINLSFISMLLLIIGIATPDWTVSGDKEFYMGLWKVCERKICTEYSDQFKPDGLKGAEACAILTILIGLVYCGLLCYKAKSSPSKVRSFYLKGGLICSNLATAIFFIATCSIWGDQFYRYKIMVHIGYSWILTITGGIFFTLTPLIALCIPC